MSSESPCAWQEVLCDALSLLLAISITILSKEIQQTTFCQRVGTSDTLPASASFPSQKRPRTVLPNTGAERRPKSTCVMLCEHSHIFRIHVPRHQVQRSPFPIACNQDLPHACSIARSHPLTATCLYVSFASERCSTFKLPSLRVLGVDPVVCVQCERWFMHGTASCLDRRALAALKALAGLKQFNMSLIRYVERRNLSFTLKPTALL